VCACGPPAWRDPLTIQWITEAAVPQDENGQISHWAMSS